jgi:DNA processing protein
MIGRGVEPLFQREELISEKGEFIARILAALEVLPAHPRDLTDLMKRGSGIINESRLESATSSQRVAQLARYLNENIDENRVAHWLSVVDKVLYAESGISCATVLDLDFPRNLLQSFDCPPLIWIKGDLVEADELSLSVVGTRAPGAEAREFAYAASTTAAKHGYSIVSGLARGIDSAAHAAALDLSERTIGVLGFGIQHRIYPPENEELSRRVVLSGALLSQFAPFAPPAPSSFVARNAVISALSRVSLMVEGGERSGTRTEVEYALKQERKVLVWRAAAERHSWIRTFAGQDGVQIIDTVEDVLAALSEAYG